MQKLKKEEGIDLKGRDRGDSIFELKIDNSKSRRINQKEKESIKEIEYLINLKTRVFLLKIHKIAKGKKNTKL